MCSIVPYLVAVGVQLFVVYQLCLLSFELADVAAAGVRVHSRVVGGVVPVDDFLVGGGLLLKEISFVG